MRDFTLIIPTYNRAPTLATLLGYLESERADCRVLVLDSSLPEARTSNRERVARSPLAIEYVEFPTEIHPIDKMRDGAHRVTTPLCALCADDDLIVLDGVRRCLDELRRNPQASVVQGYSFMFQCRRDGGLDLVNVLYFSPTIADPEPLARLFKLFRRYQAVAYGNFRTPVLRRVLDLVCPLESFLGRELLWTALAAVEGPIVRLPCFSHGRSLDPSENYEHWHPLEWLAKEPDGLFAEYVSYRQILAGAILKSPENTQAPDAVHRILDNIHLLYLVKHAPPASVEFIIDEQLKNVAFDQYWPRQEVHLPLIAAAGIGEAAPSFAEAVRRRLSLAIARLGLGAGEREGADDASSPMSLSGRSRSYLLHPAFRAPGNGVERPSRSAIGRLLDSLDNYVPAVEAAAT